MTLPQPQVNYKAEELNLSLANRFWTRNPRLKHTSPSTTPLTQQRSSLLEPEMLNSHTDSSGAETPSHVACVMQKCKTVYYLKCSSQSLCLTTL